MQRLRIKFGRGDGLKFISHLDVMRLWDRALRRAAIPVAYSEGFSPHPRMSLAVPLALGVTSEAELMDLFLTRLVSPHWFTTVVGRQLPPDLPMLGVFQAAVTLPSLQSQVAFADYRVQVEAHGSTPAGVEKAVAGLLAAEHVPWQHRRDTGERNYDLRVLVDDIRILEATASECTLEMRLRCDSRGSGRPEQVALALGFTGHPLSIHRTRLTLAV